MAVRHAVPLQEPVADSSRMPELVRVDNHWRGTFTAFVGPCEVLVAIASRTRAEDVLSTVAKEAKRIETTYSRFRDDNLVYRINHSCGQPVTVMRPTCVEAGVLASLAMLHGGRAEKFLRRQQTRHWVQRGG